MQAFLKSRSDEIDQMDFETKRAVLRSLGVRVKLSPSDDKRIPLADRVEVSVDAFSVPADGGEYVIDFTNATQGMDIEDFVADWDELQALSITA